EFATLVIGFHEDHAQGVFVDVHNAFRERILAVCGRKTFNHPHWPFFPVDAARSERAHAMGTIRWLASDTLSVSTSMHGSENFFLSQQTECPERHFGVEAPQCIEVIVRAPERVATVRHADAANAA